MKYPHEETLAFLEKAEIPRLKFLEVSAIFNKSDMREHVFILKVRFKDERTPWTIPFLPEDFLKKEEVLKLLINLGEETKKHHSIMGKLIDKVGDKVLTAAALDKELMGALFEYMRSEITASSGEKND